MILAETHATHLHPFEEEDDDDDEEEDEAETFLNVSFGLPVGDRDAADHYPVSPHQEPRFPQPSLRTGGSSRDRGERTVHFCDDLELTESSSCLPFVPASPAFPESQDLNMYLDCLIDDKLAAVQQSLEERHFAMLGRVQAHHEQHTAAMAEMRREFKEMRSIDLESVRSGIDEVTNVFKREEGRVVMAARVDETLQENQQHVLAIVQQHADRLLLSVNDLDGAAVRLRSETAALTERVAKQEQASMAQASLSEATTAAVDALRTTMEDDRAMLDQVSSTLVALGVCNDECSSKIEAALSGVRGLETRLDVGLAELVVRIARLEEDKAGITEPHFLRSKCSPRLGLQPVSEVSRHPKTLLDSSRGCVEDGGPSAEAVKRVHGSHCRCDSHTTWVSGSFDSSENSPCGGRRESGESVHLSSSDNASFTTPPQAPTPQVILSRSKDRVLEVGSALTGTQRKLASIGQDCSYVPEHEDTSQQQVPGFLSESLQGLISAAERTLGKVKVQDQPQDCIDKRRKPGTTTPRAQASSLNAPTAPQAPSLSLQAQLQVQVRPVRQVGQSPMPARVSTPATSPSPSLTRTPVVVGPTSQVRQTCSPAADRRRALSSSPTHTWSSPESLPSRTPPFGIGAGPGSGETSPMTRRRHACSVDPSNSGAHSGVQTPCGPVAMAGGKVTHVQRLRSGEAR